MKKWHNDEKWDGFAAARRRTRRSLGLGDLAFERVEMLAKRRSIYMNMVGAHFGGPSLSFEID